MVRRSVIRSITIGFLRVAVLTLLLTLPPLLAIGGSVPKAECGPNDRVETGLQGQTTRAERESGLSDLGFNCNLELVGQFEGEGTSWQLTWYGDCAYYDTANSPQQQRRGTVVIDASDPRHPQASAFLTDPTMLDPWESLKVHKGRKLLAGVQGPIPGGPGFAIYDVSDCAHPILKASVVLPDAEGHAGDFAPDGLTYYGTGGGSFYAIDVTDPSNPRQIGRFFHPTHDISISEDGTRAYLAQQGNAPATPGFGRPNGLVILDVSDIQFRRPNPQPRVISTLFWEDGSVAQLAHPVTIRGRPYLIFTDELGSGGSPGGFPAWARACDQGLPPFGFARIIDISDEANPQVVSKLILEVHDPANCPVIVNDPPFRDIFRGFNFGYSSHYCTVDDARNATMVACSYFEAGLRVFDIRDPVHPKEIAYYKPRARRTAFLPGSQLFQRSFGGDRTADWAPSNIRFRKARGEKAEKDRGELWFISQDNGFQIVRFTNGVGSARCFDPGPRGCAANE